MAGVSVTVHETLPRNPPELISRLSQADTVICIRSSTRLTYEVLSKARTVRHIALWGPGTDNVDLEAARRLGIAVSNTPDATADAVAEHTLALLLGLAHKVSELDHRVRQGEWPRGLLTQLRGKTLGIMGAGSVGRSMAALAEGIGMRVLMWTLHPEKHNPKTTGLEFVDLNTLLGESDALSIHLRGSADTAGLIGAVEISQMKPTAFIVNTGRGSVIDEEALCDALWDGAIAGAALDVFTTEPLLPDSRLLTIPNLLLSPHTASTTDETLEASLNMVVDNVLAFEAGEFRNRVV